jgi:hypothetical protein
MTILEFEPPDVAHFYDKKHTFKNVQEALATIEREIFRPLRAAGDGAKCISFDYVLYFFSGPKGEPLWRPIKKED